MRWLPVFVRKTWWVLRSVPYRESPARIFFRIVSSLLDYYYFSFLFYATTRELLSQ